MTELFNAHNLNEMRVQYNTSGLPYNYDRAVPYRSNNSPMSYSNNSWKVLGGGIEASAYELSRFGSQLLNAEIVSEDTRDNRLWQRVNTSSSVGLAWFRGTSDGSELSLMAGVGRARAATYVSTATTGWLLPLCPIETIIAHVMLLTWRPRLRV